MRGQDASKRVHYLHGHLPVLSLNMVTRTDLRLCYYKCLSVRASAVLAFKNGIDRALEYTGSSAKAWWRSPTVFYPSPVDLVAEEQIFGLERNFHKIHGWDCPPLVPDYQVPG